VHLLCHLDSPSAASLPYLGLQEQAGPEFSGFYGSYRVPSRSPPLPLRTSSPGGVAHRPTSLTQSNTAQSQPSTGNTDTVFPNSVQQSLDDLTAMFLKKERGLHTQANSASPKTTRFFQKILTGFSQAGNYTHRLSQRQTPTTRLLTEVCTRVFHAKHGFSLCDRHTRASCRLAPTLPSQAIRSNGVRTPFTACCLGFICMHQG
jgi:hypothetical protein